MAKEAKARLIESAIDLIRRDGVAGTGITEVVAHSGAARRSIYLNFPGGKDQLVTEAVTAAGKAISRALETFGEAHTPSQTLASFIALWKVALLDSDFQAGCPIAAGALAGSAAPSAPATAAATFADWEARLTEQLTTAGVAPQTAESLAVMAISTIEGAVLVSVCSRTVRPLDVALAHLNELLRLHSPSD
ncbi:TetR/AcrR family transcriptional regulator [Nocardia sp. NPDC058176]|uniref:TetR/AcrR family transcriptional regulator n=1 Tax=Nocardia sp. NPDC058176 TaxID=3346368 RepID=UPI0036DDC691